MILVGIVLTLLIARSEFPEQESGMAAVVGGLVGALGTAVFVAGWRAALRDSAGEVHVQVLGDFPPWQIGIALLSSLAAVLLSLSWLLSNNDFGKWIGAAFLIGAPIGFVGSAIEDRLR